MPTPVVEDYLKALYRLGGGGRSVPAGTLARELRVTPGTATSMMQRLDALHGLVEYRKHRGATLTRSGRREALRVLRRHRIIELFLVRVIGLARHEVHHEAERLEHAFSDRLIERLAELLGHPDYDPHGTPIPSARGAVPADVREPLSETGPGEYVVVGFTDDGGGALPTGGLGAGSVVRVLEVNRGADWVRLAVLEDGGRGAETFLGGRAAARVLVRPLQAAGAPAADSDDPVRGAGALAF